MIEIMLVGYQRADTLSDKSKRNEVWVKYAMKMI